MPTKSPITTQDNVHLSFYSGFAYTKPTFMWHLNAMMGQSSKSNPSFYLYPAIFGVHDLTAAKSLWSSKIDSSEVKTANTISTHNTNMVGAFFPIKISSLPTRIFQAGLERSLLRHPSKQLINAWLSAMAPTDRHAKGSLRSILCFRYLTVFQTIHFLDYNEKGYYTDKREPCRKKRTSHSKDMHRIHDERMKE